MQLRSLLRRYAHLNTGHFILVGAEGGGDISRYSTVMYALGLFSRKRSQMMFTFVNVLFDVVDAFRILISFVCPLKEKNFP